MGNSSYLFRTIVFFLAASISQVGFIQSAIATEMQISTSKNGLSYMTGGIGDEEVLAMRPYAKKFTLNLLFSEGYAGQSVTDVNVNIYDEQSKLVFRIKGAKPVLYVNLPAGNYTILANNNGAKLRHKLTIEKNTHQRVILNWKNEELDSQATEEPSN